MTELLDITGMLNFKVKSKRALLKAVIERLLPRNVYSDTVADCSHRKETILSSCQLKCGL